MWRDMEAIFGVFHVSMFKFDMVNSYGELYEFNIARYESRHG